MAEPQENTGELGWPEFIKTRVVTTITYSGVSDRLDFLNHSLLIRLRRKGNRKQIISRFSDIDEIKHIRSSCRSSPFFITIDLPHNFAL